MSLCVEKQWCGFASLKMFVFMWQKYDDFCFMWLKTMIYASFSFSAQDSMDEACAEGIGNEHYRLEGRSLPIFFLSVVKLVGVLFQLNGKKTLSQKHYLELNFRYLCGSLIQCFIPSSSAPHHTHSLSPSNVLMKSLLLSLLPFHLLHLSSAPPQRCTAKCLHSPMFFPWCDVILD